jgi:energy-converting hydrogenase Eha subunit A
MVLIIGGLLFAVIVGLAVAVAAGVPLVEDQRALAAEPGATHKLVHELELLGFLKVRAQELVLNRFDAFTSLALTTVAVAAFATALFIRTVGGVDWRPLRNFWIVVAAGAAWLAFDELASVHESAGFTFELWFGSIPGFAFEGDLFFALYLVPAIAFVVIERRQIARCRICVRLLIVAVAAFALNAVLDSTLSHLDEVLEALIAALLIFAFTRLAAAHVAAELRSVGVVPQPLGLGLFSQRSSATSRSLAIPMDMPATQGPRRSARVRHPSR